LLPLGLKTRSYEVPVNAVITNKRQNNFSMKRHELKMIQINILHKGTLQQKGIVNYILLFMKTFIPVSWIFDSKTTFSFFPEMFKNSAPAKYYSKKQNQKYYEILTIYDASKNNR